VDTISSNARLHYQPQVTNDGKTIVGGECQPKMRWREWMGRVEAVIFASPEPVGRETLARVVGRDCSLDLLIDDIRDELRERPYELVSVAGGWRQRFKKGSP
jgi:segregation and condensation protein B